ncbi:uncharacterized protein [Dermacentor albipictus]|uniref:uncharacterized protein isoform X3 n=1 Tax=Dermacentor albipictus TaxID=60249 RepID=UPI0038FBEBE9
MQKARKRFKGRRRQQLHPTKRMLQSPRSTKEHVRELGPTRAVGHLAGAPKTKQLDRRAHVPRAAPAFEAREPANGLFSSLEAALLPLPCCPLRTIKQLFGTASILHLTALFGTASILHLTASLFVLLQMDEQQVDAADIEEGLLRLLGRCIHKINRARRQEKRLNIYTHAQKEPPEKVKKEVRDRRAELRSSIDAVMNYEEGAAVAQDAAPAPDSSGEDDNAQIHPALANRLSTAFNSLDAWKRAAVRVRQHHNSEDVGALSARKSEGRQALQNLPDKLNTVQAI